MGSNWGCWSRLYGLFSKLRSVGKKGEKFWKAPDSRTLCSSLSLSVRLAGRQSFLFL